MKELTRIMDIKFPVGQFGLFQLGTKHKIGPDKHAIEIEIFYAHDSYSTPNEAKLYRWFVDENPLNLVYNDLSVVTSTGLKGIYKSIKYTINTPRNKSWLRYKHLKGGLYPFTIEEYGTVKNGDKVVQKMLVLI